MQRVVALAACVCHFRADGIGVANARGTPVVALPAIQSTVWYCFGTRPTHSVGLHRCCSSVATGMVSTVPRRGIAALVRAIDSKFVSCPWSKK